VAWDNVTGKPSTFAPSAHASSHVTGGSDVIANAVASGNAGLMSGTDKAKLDGIASGAEVNVNADWNAGSGDAQILNKPTLGTLSALDNGTLTNAKYCTYVVGTGIVCTSDGGGMVYPGAGIAVSTGSAWTTSLTAPSGAVVGTSDSQELSNKTFGTGMTWPTFNQTTTGTAAGLTAAYIDWSAGSGGASILNKPTLGTISTYNVGTLTDTKLCTYSTGSGFVCNTTASGTGDFVGPASSTDNAVVLFDGTTGKLGKNSPWTMGTDNSLNTNAADNTAYVEAANTGQPPTANGRCFYDTTNDWWSCYNGSSWDNVLWSNSAAARFPILNQDTTGTAYKVPTGTGPTIDAAGKIGIDTTADQFRFYGASAAKNLDPRHTENATFKSPASGDKAKFRKPYGMTVSSVGCVTDAATSAVLDVQECNANGASCVSILSGTITCGTTYGTGSVTDAAIAAGGYVFFSVGTVTGSVGYLYADFNYTVTSE
jgi:hypothetical protein